MEKPDFTGIENRQMAAYAEATKASQEEPAAVKVADTSSAPPRKIRTHHPWLHPTKGWRMFSRPRKANRGRRKLIPLGKRELHTVRIQHKMPTGEQMRAAVAALVGAGLPLGASHVAEVRRND